MASAVALAGLKGRCANTNFLQVGLRRRLKLGDALHQIDANNDWRTGTRRSQRQLSQVFANWPAGRQE